MLALFSLMALLCPSAPPLRDNPCCRGLQCLVFEVVWELRAFYARESGRQSPGKWKWRSHPEAIQDGQGQRNNWKIVLQLCLPSTPGFCSRLVGRVWDHASNLLRLPIHTWQPVSLTSII